MTQDNVPEWFYHSPGVGQNSSGITLQQLKQILCKDDIHSNTLVWHPTFVPQWTQLKSLPKNIQKILNMRNKKKTCTKSKDRDNINEHSKSQSQSQSQSHSYSYSYSYKKSNKLRQTTKHKKRPTHIDYDCDDYNQYNDSDKNVAIDISGIAPLSQFTRSFKLNHLNHVTLKQFISNYNNVRRDEFMNKLTFVKGLYNERNDKSLKIEKDYFNAQYIYKKSELNSKEKFIAKQIEIYSKGIFIINKNMKSSKTLKQFIAKQMESTSNKNINSNNKKTLRKLQRKSNMKLKKEINEYRKFECLLKKACSEMIEQVSKQNKSMLIIRKRLQEMIENITNNLQLQCKTMEKQFSSIIRIQMTESEREIESEFEGSEGSDVCMAFDELHLGLYLLYNQISKKEYEFNVIHQREIRKQCMIHRMFWKKYTQMISLQNKMNEMKKREYESNQYTTQLEKDMNDINENGKLDKYQMQINNKQSLIKTKYNSLKHKQNTLKILKNTLKKYKINANTLTNQINEMEKENHSKQTQIIRAEKKKFQNLINSQKIDIEMKQYLIERKQSVKTNQLQLNNLFKDLNDKRFKLKSLQYDTKQIKNQYDFDVISSEFDDDAYGDASASNSDISSNVPSADNSNNEKEMIQELKKNLLKQEYEISCFDVEIKKEKERMQNDKKSLELVCDTHQSLESKYKQCNESIDKLNQERNDKFKEMFDLILADSNKVLIILNNFNNFNINKDDIYGEDEHEPGTTPTLTAVCPAVAVAVDNNAIISKIYHDLNHVYDIFDDLDFENTILSIRSVMDSIRNDREKTNQTLLNEKTLLQIKEKEIEKQYKKQRTLLKKTRQIQKKQFEKERRKQKQQIHNIRNKNINENDSLSSLSNLDTDSSFNDSETDKQQKRKKKSRKKRKSRKSKKLKQSKQQNSNKRISDS